jgi:hypothetical protein
MNIRESDTSFNDADQDTITEAQAEECLASYMRGRDLELLAANCASHTSSSHRVYLDASKA